MSAPEPYVMMAPVHEDLAEDEAALAAYKREALGGDWADSVRAAGGIPATHPLDITSPSLMPRGVLVVYPWPDT